MLCEVLPFLAGLSPFWIYLVLGIGAGLENIIPPVPADTVVVLGGFLAAGGAAEPAGIFLATWSANVTTALAVYLAGARYGPRFFETAPGRLLLRPHQLRRLESYYGRWGKVTIFATRFLPGFRALVPAFAGVTGQRLLPVALPLAGASAIWYGLLTWLGTTAGRNAEGILDWLGGLNRTLLLLALAFGAVVLWRWYRSRNAEDGGSGMNAAVPGEDAGAPPPGAGGLAGPDSARSSFSDE